ncbi:fructose-2,6-bisphosphatase TIGAR [Rhincodon typus]|uniref:fructose-2,6-bisphosphatase TIGAR n=1 Tax=Rhincodon typus TaxID=259920 RepID=UPI00202F2C8C|nr:fructose-2,6-bisphosphatase TIGAR [Rhincodon typus]
MRFRVILVRQLLEILETDVLQISHSCLTVLSGETRYNKAKLLQGQGVDEPLSEFGSKQAKAAGQTLGKIKFSHVFSSDLQRYYKMHTNKNIPINE